MKKLLLSSGLAMALVLSGAIVAHAQDSGITPVTVTPAANGSSSNIPTAPTSGSVPVIQTTSGQILSPGTGGQFVPLAPIPGLDDSATLGSSLGTGSIATFLNNLYQFLIGISVALAIGFIIWGGFMIATQDSAGGHSKGRDYIQNALIGLALVLAPYLVLYTINPAIVSNLGVTMPALNLGQYAGNGVTFGQNYATPGAQTSAGLGQLGTAASQCSQFGGNILTGGLLGSATGNGTLSSGTSCAVNTVSGTYNTTVGAYDSACGNGITSSSCISAFGGIVAAPFTAGTSLVTTGSSISAGSGGTQTTTGNNPNQPAATGSGH